MSKHTPGPWIETKHTAGWGRCIVSTDSYGIIVAKIGFRDRPREERDANARLIAAAPELVEALRDLCMMGILDPHSSDDGGEDGEAAIARRRARALLARIDGDA